MRNPEQNSVIEATIRRIAELTETDAEHAVKEILAEAPDPESAINRLERWLKSLATPAAAFEALSAYAPLGRLLGRLFGLSRHLSEVLVQNPELAYLVLEPSELEKPLNVEELIAEGKRLLEPVKTYQHRQDRIRFLRQRETLRIALADLGGLWSQRAVWQAISDTADAILTLVLQVEQHEMDFHDAFAIVAYGKLGGGELNYSSDIDLVFVAGENADRDRCVKLAEAVSRALTKPMGRGSLYRVDLRLRPFGSRGALAPGIKAYQSYFERHAASWEHVALIRSRAVCGDADLCLQWEDIRVRYAFPERTMESEISDLYAMRERSREDERNLKLGPGGIRDIEIVTQSLQFALGGKNPKVRVRHTLDALEALAEETAMPESEAERLAENYTFLRQVEHRIQMIDSEQTQLIPDQIDRLVALSKSLGYRSTGALMTTLDSLRDSVTASYRRYAPTASQEPALKALLERLSDAPKDIALWVATLPNADPYAEALMQNKDSLDRLIELHKSAPALLPMLARSEAVLEQVISGEILEFFKADHRFGKDHQRLTDKQLGERIARGVLRIQTRWVLDSSFHLGAALAKMYEASIQAIAARTAPDLRMFALGSLASEEVTPYSDVDLILFVEEENREAGVIQARSLIALVSRLRESGVPIAIDLRLRPGGAAGSLVTTPGAYIRYAHVVMEPWERLAALRFREIVSPSGGERTFSTLELRKAAVRPMEQHELLKLLEIKDRIEKERVPVQHRLRHIKLGHGGLDDIEWRIGVSLLAHQEVDPERFDSSLKSRAEEMVRLELISGDEGDQLLSDFDFLGLLRARLSLFGYTDDVLPENPDKLRHIAMSMGFESANDLLAASREVRERVRARFEAVRDGVRNK